MEPTTRQSKQTTEFHSWIRQEHSLSDSDEGQEPPNDEQSNNVAAEGGTASSSNHPPQNDAVNRAAPSDWASWYPFSNSNTVRRHKKAGATGAEDSIELSKVTTTNGGALLFHRRRKKHRKKRQKGDRGKEPKQRALFDNEEEDADEDERPGYHPLQADIESSEASIWVILAAIRNAQRILGPFSLVETAAWLWYCLKYGAPVIPRQLRDKLNYDEEFLGLTYPQYPTGSDSSQFERGGDTMTFKRYESSHFKRIRQPGAKNISNELHHWSLFAAAGYAGDSVEFARRARIPPTDVVACNFQSTHCRPAYVICIDRQAEAIVIVIRGTRTRYDILTDLAGADVELDLDIPDNDKSTSRKETTRDKEEAAPAGNDPLEAICRKYPRSQVQKWLKDGKVHEGFLYCANVLLGRSPVVDQESGKVLSLTKQERRNRERRLAQQSASRKRDESKQDAEASNGTPANVAGHDVSTKADSNSTNSNSGTPAQTDPVQSPFCDTWKRTYGSANRNAYCDAEAVHNEDGVSEDSEYEQESDWDELQKEELQSLGGIGAIALEYLAEFSDYRLIVTGHSLGGGVAALLAMKLLFSSNVKFAREAHKKCAQSPINEEQVDPNESPADWPFQSYPLHCFCYGVPPICSEELGNLFEPYITSVVLGDDMVPRLSLHSVAAVRAAARMSRTVWIEDLRAQLLRHPVGKIGSRALQYVGVGWEACRDVATLVLGKLWGQLGEYVWKNSSNPPMESKTSDSNENSFASNQSATSSLPGRTMFDWLYQWMPRGSHSLRRISGSQSAPPDSSEADCSPICSDSESDSDEDFSERDWVYLTEGMVHDMSLELQQMNEEGKLRGLIGEDLPPPVDGVRRDSSYPREIGGTNAHQYAFDMDATKATLRQEDEEAACTAMDSSRRLEVEHRQQTLGGGADESAKPQTVSFTDATDNSPTSIQSENPEDDIPPQTLFVPGSIYHIAPWDARLFQYGFTISRCRRHALSMLVVSPYMWVHHRRRSYLSSLNWLTSPDIEM
eukprot:gb/GECG01001550.1/.p1 GENE.gb/GECG01001550.1/~~gb/GECG01001550.1/.p1  ORF type:complete len:1017 (+),score=131.06 gb/GECG01001550.1/:1-3051(+)